jgi:phospholipase A1
LNSPALIFIFSLSLGVTTVAISFASANTLVANGSYYAQQTLPEQGHNEHKDEQNNTPAELETDAQENLEPNIDEQSQSMLDERIDSERTANRNQFSLVQHRQNYLLPFSYVSQPNSITLDGVGAELIDNFEAKYQISVKTPLWLQQDDLSGVYFGFTAVSFWQLYNSETSKPFRETNYEPEVFYQFNSKLSVFGYKFNILRVGLNHMSNGESGLKSRSWNRITATALFSDKNTAYYVRSWYRLPEDKKTSLLDPLGDDNPDINDYYGRIEVGFGWEIGELDVFSQIRNNLSLKDNRSGIEINVTYPFNRRYDLLLQYFNGYGDSLIDYNRHQQRISLGIQLRFL